MPRGYHRQYPAPSDFGIESEIQRAVNAAMIQTWKDRLRAIFTPDDADPGDGADGGTREPGVGMPVWLFKLIVLAGLAAAFATGFHWLGDSPWAASLVYGLFLAAAGVVIASAAAWQRSKS